jgi:hypothetical protein
MFDFILSADNLFLYLFIKNPDLLKHLSDGTDVDDKERKSLHYFNIK